MRVEIEYGASRNSKIYKEEIEVLAVEEAEMEAFRLAQLLFNDRARKTVEDIMRKTGATRAEALNEFEERRLKTIHYKVNVLDEDYNDT